MSVFSATFWNWVGSFVLARNYTPWIGPHSWILAKWKHSLIFPLYSIKIFFTNLESAYFIVVDLQRSATLVACMRRRCVRIGMGIAPSWIFVNGTFEFWGSNRLKGKCLVFVRVCGSPKCQFLWLLKLAFGSWSWSCGLVLALIDVFCQKILYLSRVAWHYQYRNTSPERYCALQRVRLDFYLWKYGRFLLLKTWVISINVNVCDA